ncbi:polysaccharide export protein [candidate division KSB1 bacterium]|nr:polysaccharide export protein [candidate division KSB1 bacterium]
MELKKVICASFLILILSLFNFNCSAPATNSNVKPAIFQVPLYRPESQMPEYKIGVGDELEFKFFGNERFNEYVIVRPDGRITLQRIGDLYVNGMTPSVLDSMVTRTYSQIINSPDITIFIRKCSGKFVYVTGEVKMPGPYPLQNGLTILQALALARWETDDANLKSILLLRRTNETTMSAQAINVSEMLKPGGTLDDQVLEGDDVIFVPRTFIANVEHFIRNYYDIVLPPWQIFWQIQTIEWNFRNRR